MYSGVKPRSTVSARDISHEDLKTPRKTPSPEARVSYDEGHILRRVIYLPHFLQVSFGIIKKGSRLYVRAIHTPQFILQLSSYNYIVTISIYFQHSYVYTMVAIDFRINYFFFRTIYLTIIDSLVRTCSRTHCRYPNDLMRIAIRQQSNRFPLIERVRLTHIIICARQPHVPWFYGSESCKYVRPLIGVELYMAVKLYLGGKVNKDLIYK